jgi:predicted permease
MDLLTDVRSSVRGFRRHPLPPIVAVTILALGLAAAVTVFNYINGYSRSFPGAASTGLVRVFGVARDDPYQNLSYPDFTDYATQASRAFTGMAAAQPYFAASVRRETMTEVAFLTAVTGNFFSVLDVRVVLGRPITPADDRPGAPAVAVLSHRWWQRSFAGSGAVIGQTLYLNFRPFTIVGVAAPDFLGTTSDYRPDVWIPIAPFRDRYRTWTAQAENRDIPLVRVYGRLRDGGPRERAEGELRTIAAGLDATHPRRDGARRIRLDSPTWIEPGTRTEELPTVRVMLLAAGGLLALVCANVANLLLAMAAGRERELAMRAALGASAGRLRRGALAENVLLAIVAGGVGLAVAVPATARLGSFFARPSVWGEHVPREAVLDLRTVVFAVALSILVGLAAGVLPAHRASRRQLAAALKPEAAGSGAGPRRVGGRRLPGMHDILVASQVALAVVLLVVAGLVLRTLGSARAVDPGFAHDRLVGTHISTSSTSVQAKDRDRFFRELVRRLAEEPWVHSATFADNAPLSALGAARVRFEDPAEPVEIGMTRVLPGFFETMGIGRVQGRTFTAGDTGGAPAVAIVNEALVRRFFPAGQPVGRRLWWPARDSTERTFEIVGVVRDARMRDVLAAPEPVVYFSFPQQAYATGGGLVVQTTIPPAAAVQPLRAWLRRFEPHLAIVNVLPYPEVVRGFLYVQRMNAELFATLGFLGLALATVGSFSVVSLAVARRRREMGIRLAVGARRGEILRLVVFRAMMPVLAGVGVGQVGAIAVTGLVRRLLFGVAPTDPLALAGAPALLMATAVLAALLPARRASRVDPMHALRAE